MIRIVVVEDKHPILRSIKRKIESFSPETIVVGEATDGESALSLINKLKPHIVFTDIMMPVMDGLQLISRVREISQDIVFVIISGYDNFEYARQAIKLGVTDYLLKPVKQEAVHEILTRVVNIVKAGTYAQQQKLLYSILNSGISTLSDENMKVEYEFYIVLLLCVGPYSNLLIDFSNPLNIFWSNIDIYSIVSGHLKQGEALWVFDGKAPNEQLLVIGLDKYSNTHCRNLAELILNSLNSYNVPITIAASDRKIKASDIGIEYQLLRTLLKKYLIFGKSSIISKEKLNLISVSENYFIDSALEKKLTAILQKRQKGVFASEIKKLLSNWENYDYTQTAIEKLLKQIVRLCGKVTVNQLDFNNDIELEIDEILSASKDYNSLLQGLSSVFNLFFQEDREHMHAPDSIRGIVDSIEKYVKQHFAERISINDIADMVKLNVSYLSRAFKNYKGVTLIDYITQLRIEKAKELISADPNLMLKDIAEIVGYSNQYYFSRVFKIITGQSPTDYKACCYPSMHNSDKV